MPNLQLFDIDVELQNNVSKIWYRSFEKEDNITPIRTIPDASIEFYLLLNGGIKLKTQEEESHKEKSYIRGIVNSFGEFTPTKDFIMIGIRCMPWTAKDLFKIPVDELYNQRIDMDLIQTPFTKLIPNKLNPAEIKSMVRHINREIIKNSKPLSKEERMVKNALNIIYYFKGKIKVLDLSRLLKISIRHVRRVFKQYLGCTPKDICTIIKIREAIKFYSENRIKNLSQIAYEFGYSDQSHFIKDFKSIVGQTPSEYFDLFENEKFV